MPPGAAGRVLEPEPAHWQPRVLWTGARLLCGAATFFFVSFVFAYFYLRSLDANQGWRIGKAHPSLGLGIAITLVLILSAGLLRFAARRPLQSVLLAAAALALALLAVVLQVIEWTTLGFGGASGGYASVFIGWTVTYAFFAVACAYWIATQVATVSRMRRSTGEAAASAVAAAGLEACSFFWAFYVAIGVLAFIILYIV